MFCGGIASGGPLACRPFSGRCVAYGGCSGEDVVRGRLESSSGFLKPFVSTMFLPGYIFPPLPGLKHVRTSCPAEDTLAGFSPELFSVPLSPESQAASNNSLTLAGHSVPENRRY